MSPNLAVQRALGKVILLGEHAVVYGIPAIAVGIDRGARADSTPNDGETCTLHVRGWDITVHEREPADPSNEPSLGPAFRSLLRETRARQDEAGVPLVGNVRVSAEADLPPGGGLGCSAAMGVAVARALDPQASADEIASRVMAWEKVFHGNPSGIDAAVSASGGCIYFRRGKPMERVTSKAPLVLAVGNTGTVSSTKTMVEVVARQLAQKKETTERAFEGIRVLVENARHAIEAGDREALGKLLDLNQMLLAGLFVSGEDIEKMCGAARENGALGAKLTGAGGGGSVVALAPSTEVAQKIVAAWEKGGFTGFVTTVAAPVASPSSGRGAKSQGRKESTP
jgi:mevalonate kinase